MLIVKLKTRSAACAEQVYKVTPLISIKILFDNIDFHTDKFCIIIYLNLNQKYLKILYMYHFIIVFAISR